MGVVTTLASDLLPQDDPEREAVPASASAALLDRYRRLVPGAAHTYAKGHDQYPEGLAPFITRGEGARVWDTDGREYLELGSGLRSVTLGHAHPRVVAAATASLHLGTNFVRPAAVEIEAAEEFLDLFPGLDMVKFAKNGSDATTAAVRLSRAATGRDLVAICADQPFFSTDDWFIGTTAMPGGIPEESRSQTVRFPYNDLDALHALFSAHPGRIACVVMEAAAAQEPLPGYLESVQALCRAAGVVLVFDEMITGFRWAEFGAQHAYGITPDLATFGKACANGFAVSALAGRRDLMELGGIDHDRERVFLLSTTHGAETHALAAARETWRVYQDEDVVATMYARGRQLAAGVRAAAAERGLSEHFVVLGRDCNLVYATLDAAGERSQVMRTLFLQETVRRGLLAPSFVTSAALTQRDVDEVVGIVATALDVYALALDHGADRFLFGRPVKPVFRARA
jgi:glutamate-1-semialdehyde 2,1-aminomutase